MTILHLIQKPQLRGAEIFASQLAKHTHLYGHKAVMVFLFPGNVQLPFDGKTISLDGTKSHRFWNITAWRKLAQIIREEKPDIIQANAGDTLKYAVFSKLFFRWKQPIVFRNASTISLYIKTWPAKVWNGLLFRQASRIISVSNVSAADFGSLYPQLKDRIAVVPIGIEEQSVKERPAEVQSKDGPVLIHVGGFTYEKNHIRLIAIFQRLLAIYPNACLRLVGDGPLRKDMEEIVQQKGLADHIVFCGAQKDVMYWLAEADVLLLPSIIEGLPGVILEAFYCRIPVVAYDVGGIKEILINDTTGHLVQKGDENAFVNAVIDVIRDSHDNERMITNARQLVIAGYLNRRITKRFIRVYESVIQHWNKNYHYRPLI